MGEWRRLRIGDVCDIVKGETGLASATPGQYPMVATGAERRSCNTYQFDTEAVCIPLVSSTGHGKKTLNYVHFQSGKFALGTILAAVIPKDPKNLTARYLHLYLSHFKDTVLVPLMKGAANVSLPMKGIASVEIPVPSVSEQQKLIDLIGRIESEHRELLEEGNRQAGLFKQLRQAVLQEAVEGKLTADWRRQHPVVKADPQHDAAALLAQIKVEKERLVKAGKIRKGTPLPPIVDSDKPFELPAGWVWCRLGEVAQLITSGSRDWARHYQENGRAKFVRMGNLSHDSYQLKQDKMQRVEPPANGEGTRTRLLEGDLLVSITGDVGWMGLVPPDFGEAYINQHTAMVRLLSPIRTTLIPNFLLSPLAKKQFDEPQRGIKNSFRLSDLQWLQFPLPPLAEQRAIVARVDILMAMINELEKQVAERKEQAQMLMQAVLWEAFAGGEEAEGDDTCVGATHASPDYNAPRATRARHASPLREPTAKTGRVGLTHAPAKALPLVAETPPAYKTGGQAALPAANQPVPARILAAMQPARDYARAELLAVTGINEADWIWAIRQLKEQGRVVQKGEKRGARYVRK